MIKRAGLMIFVAAELFLFLIAAVSCTSEDGGFSPAPVLTPTSTPVPTATPASEPVSTPTHTFTPPTPAPTQELCSWLHSWDTTLDSTSFKIHFTCQIGNKVVGTYDREDGQLSGTISGNTLTGTWREEPAYSSPNDSGEFVFTMAPDCTSFTGQRRYGTTGAWNAWSGTKIEQ